MSTVYVNEIIGYHVDGFRQNRSNADEVFYTPLILQNNETITGEYVTR